MPSIVDETQIHARSQRGKTQLLGSRSLEWLVERERMPKDRARDIGTKRRHRRVLAGVDLLRQRRAIRSSDVVADRGVKRTKSETGHDFVVRLVVGRIEMM